MEADCRAADLIKGRFLIPCVNEIFKEKKKETLNIDLLLEKFCTACLISSIARATSNER